MEDGDNNLLDNNNNRTAPPSVEYLMPKVLATGFALLNGTPPTPIINRHAFEHELD